MGMRNIAGTVLATALLASTTGHAGVLYGVVGDGGGNGLHIIDTATGNPGAQLLPLGNGNDGESIAYNPNDGLLYHMSGISAGSQFYETIDPNTLTVGPNIVPGNSYPSPPTSGEFLSLAWYDPLGVFIGTDRDEDVYHITTGGVFTEINDNAEYMRGLAVVGTRVFGVNPFGSELWELDPLTGAVIGTTTVSIDGVEAVRGMHGLAWDPDTDTVFGIGKDPTGSQPGNNRLLFELDVASGAATSIGFTGRPFAGLTVIPDAIGVPVPATVWLLVLGVLGGAVARRG